MNDDLKPKWDLNPKFEAPIVGHEKSIWQKLRSFFTPQVNAAIVGWVLMIIFTIAFANNRAKVQDLQHTNSGLKADINRLTTEKTALEGQYAVYSAIPLQVPMAISNLANLSATDPTNRQLIFAMMSAVQSITNTLADIALMPDFAVFINHRLLTNNAIIALDESRTLRIQISSFP